MEPSELPNLTRRRAGNPWTRRLLIFIGCAILLDSLVGDRGLAATLRAQQEYAHAIAELQALRNQNATLRAEMHRLVEDPSAIEAVARQDLGLIGPGEILVILKDAQ